MQMKNLSKSLRFELMNGSDIDMVSSWYGLFNSLSNTCNEDSIWDIL